MSQELAVVPACHRCFLAKSSRDHVVVLPSGAASQDYHRLIPSLFKDQSAVSTRSLLKLVQELSSMLTEHSLLMRLLGTPKDGLLHRSRMACLQSRCSQMTHCMKAHFVDTFRSLVEKGPPSITEAAEESSGFPPCSMEVLAQSDIVELGKSFRIFLACLHSLEQDLCQTAHLFQLFPLHPSSDGTVKPQFVHTGTTSGMEQMFSAVCESLLLSTSEQFRQERESWKQLAKLTADVRDLNESLHQDSVLGSIVTYILFNPDETRLTEGIVRPAPDGAQSSNLRLLSPASASNSQENMVSPSGSYSDCRLSPGDSNPVVLI